MIIPEFLFPTHATEMLEQTLGNATIMIVANISVKTAESSGYATSNFPKFLTTPLKTLFVDI